MCMSWESLHNSLHNNKDIQKTLKKMMTFAGGRHDPDRATGSTNILEIENE